jgi:hypothetical protein
VIQSAVFAIAALHRMKCLFLWLFWVRAAMLSARSKYTSVDLTPKMYISETSGKSIQTHFLLDMPITSSSPVPT